MSATDRLPRNVWVALGLVVAYVALAAGLGGFLSSLAPDDDATAQFSLSHFLPLAIAIAMLLGFLLWAGWGRSVWQETPTPTLQPRRWWLVSIPVLAALLPLTQIPSIPWADRTVGFILVIAVGTLMVGLGEELLFRGILLTTVRVRHGEFATMLVTAFVFALAHIPGSVIAGVSLGSILFQVAVLAATGVVYYWVRRTTGRLWVAVVIHALTDWTLYLASGEGTPTAGLTHPATSTETSPLTATIQFLLWVAAAISVVSVIREDRRRKER